MLPQPLLICHSAFIKLAASLGIKSTEKGDLTKTKRKQELLCHLGYATSDIAHFENQSQVQDEQKYLHSSVYPLIFLLQHNHVANVALSIFECFSVPVPCCVPQTHEYVGILFCNKTRRLAYHGKHVLASTVLINPECG